MIASIALLASASLALGAKYDISVDRISATPSLSWIDGNSKFQQAFNPTWVEPTKGTNYREGIIVRSQNCSSDVGGACVACGGAQSKASVLAFAEYDTVNKKFKSIDGSNVVFGPADATDSWGTEDPRMQYNKEDGMYYMFYTAYNGSAIFLNLASTKNPTDVHTNEAWTRHGPVFPSQANSKSAALLLKSNVDTVPLSTNYLFWGDHDIRVTTSDDVTRWDSIGDVIISPRSDHFDSLLTESGPPPLLLSSGDYLFFYNSATVGWPNAEGSAYNVGYVILDKADPRNILQRSETPILSPTYAYQQGGAPYTCNMPNVVFLEAAKPTGVDEFEVYFGAADNTIGTARVTVSITA